jgi:hypothetical protein
MAAPAPLPHGAEQAGAFASRSDSATALIGSVGRGAALIGG